MFGYWLGKAWGSIIVVSPILPNSIRIIFGSSVLGWVKVAKLGNSLVWSSKPNFFFPEEVNFKT